MGTEYSVRPVGLYSNESQVRKYKLEVDARRIGRIQANIRSVRSDLAYRKGLSSALTRRSQRTCTRYCWHSGPDRGAGNPITKRVS
jgi:hypothetical protein